MELFTKIKNGADILSAPFFNRIREKHPILYGQLYGHYFRSTLLLVEKKELLFDFLARGNLNELPSLIQTFKEHYRIEDIPNRNNEMLQFLMNKENTNHKNIKS